VIVFQLVLSYLPLRRRLPIAPNPDGRGIAGLRSSADGLRRVPLAAPCGWPASLPVRFGNITVVAGQGLELQVVAAVVVGGVNIFGGSGSIVGAFVGATLINVLQQSLIRWPR